MARSTTATIHPEALRHNLGVVRRFSPASKVMAIVKADGYGHGLERVANALSGADAFGVAALADAERLRAAGMSQPVLLLSGFDDPDDLPRMRALNVWSVIHHASQLEMLEQSDGTGPLRCWLKVDTGMHRLGFLPDAVHEAYARLKSLPSVEDDIGLLQHFASSDEYLDSASRGEQTLSQLKVFETVTADLRGERSMANSAAVLGWPQSHGDWVRPGGALYGISVCEGKTGADYGLRPAMTFTTRLISVKKIPAGGRVGYAGTWTAPEEMTIGIAAVGYGDGYPRTAASGTRVKVGDKIVPTVGRVSMDLMTVDLRTCPEAAPGDLVTLWGEGVPVEHVGESAGTIGYEPVCSITRRVRFVED